MGGSPQQLPLKHYLEDNNYHLEQQQLQQVIQKRRKLNESNSIQLHLQQITIQATQPLEEYSSFESPKPGKSWSQKPTNIVHSRCLPFFRRRFRGNAYISSKPNTIQNYSQLSSNGTVQFKTYSKSCQFEPLEEKVSLVNNNNNSLGSSFQQSMTSSDNDGSQKTIDNNFNNQLDRITHQQKEVSTGTNKCMIPADASDSIRNHSIAIADHHDSGNENQEFSILNIIPSLISEKHRKAAFVENLVDTAGLIIEVIWANFSVNPSAKIIPLRLFLQETLRRSRTSYSTLQTALFYLFRIKPQISSISRRPEYPPTPSSEYLPDANQSQNNDPATCGRRMFLAALIVASKYLQDRNYSNRAWSKISGLPVHEINANEICFLKLIDYNLFIAEDIFKRWSSLLLKHIQAISGSEISNPDAFRRAENQREVAIFRETLRSMDPKTMDYHNRSNVGIYPATPADSAPSSPREHNSDNMQISKSYPSVTQQPTPPISYGKFVENSNRTLDNYM
ncbi:cyclin-domain-containing protein [Glomus cerebriforme]|uniref:Cyclin-domain-containing protein n=1 Tax=Glomus cerebriforme TaxID=658196 RepID=A0A397TI63_9GLOM|nr:cyclin-domain-containing protein [Glomus cerebriforme]